MAIGLARLFGIVLPINFYSPYKSVNIIDFWRRWHISLSRFLRDFIYIPLGGNRHGVARRYANLAIAMLLGGLWHGAAWTFVLWGALHGLMLALNHAWHALRHHIGLSPRNDPVAVRIAAWALTFIAVTSAWVLSELLRSVRQAQFCPQCTASRGKRWSTPWWPICRPNGICSMSSDGRNPALFGCCWSARLHFSCLIRISFFGISGRRWWNAHSRTPRPGRGCAGGPTRGGPCACHSCC